MAASSKDAQNESESPIESDTVGSESRETTTPSHSRSNSSVSPPAWRVVFLSSKVRQSSVLNAAARSSVLFVSYKYDNTTLESLLLQAQQKLAGRKAESIAFLVHGQGSNSVICANDEQVNCFFLCAIPFVFIFKYKFLSFLYSEHYQGSCRQYLFQLQTCILE